MTRLQRLVLSPQQFQGQQVLLNQEQQRYLCQVLRLKANDRFIAMNGCGLWWLAQLHSDRASAQLLESLSFNYELPLPLMLIASPPKGSGFEEVIRSTTELGVAEIYPLLSERTVHRPSAKKLERWQKIAVESTEQSLRQKVPVVYAPIDLQSLEKPEMPWHQQSGLCLFGSTGPSATTLWDALDQMNAPDHITLVTGPEGGWSPSEEKKLQNIGFQPVSFGKRILRAVTAPICAVSIAASFLECQTNPYSNF